MTKITITDIANKCGVSIKTVSRVLNNYPNVSDDTRKKVYQVMKETGYQVNMLARGLKGSRTNIIVVFADRHKEEYLSIWHNMMLKYLFRFANENGLKVVMSPSNSEKFEEDETDAFYLIASGIAEGAILLETIHNDPRAEYFAKTETPFVVFGEQDEQSIHSVTLDNYDVGYKGGTYLAEKFYKNIVFFVGEDKFLSTQQRINGFEESLADSEVKYHIFTGIDTIEKAYNKAKKLIGRIKIDAFFVSGDERAIGVYRAINEKGLSIPKDIAVLGIDNILIGAYLYPPISTVEQDFKVMAKVCIDKLLLQMEGNKEEGALAIKYPSKILERLST